ncbi:MAG: M4 family metallopeptidase [Chitinophagales bacterium]
MKRVYFLIIATCVCYTCNLFAQTNFKITEKVTDKNAVPIFIKVESSSKQASNEQAEKLFLQQLYKANNFVTFEKIREDNAADGEKMRSYQQYYKGLKVFGGGCVVHSKNNDVEYVNGRYADLAINVIPKISEQQLTDYLKDAIYEETKLAKELQQPIEISLDKKELVICPNYINPEKEVYYLAYKVYVSSNNPFIRSDYFIDANSGKLLGVANLVCTLNANGTAQTVYSGTKPIVADSYNSQYRLREINRNGTTAIQTFNLNHGLESDIGSLATDILDNDNNWTLSEHPIDKDAHDIHWATEKVIDYWKIVQNRNSLDNNGMTVKSYIHYGDAYLFENAFWGGYSYPYTTNMYYSDGYTKFKSLSSLDVIAHETGHGVCQYSTTLDPFLGENGALAEGLSDIWGAVIENWAMPNSPPKNKWLIAEEIVQSGTNLRNMSNPNGSQLASPDTYGGTYWGTPPYANDPHKHCTVLDYWFYLLSDGGSGTNDIGNAFSVTGIGMSKAAKIVYETEKAPLSTYATFLEMRSVSILKARLLYGCGSAEEIAVTKAWFAVGVGANYGSPTLSISGPNSICNTGGSAYCTVSGVPNGETVTWNVSPSTVATLNAGTYDCYVNRVGNANGLVTLTASIVVCGVTYTATKYINVGSAYTLYGANGCNFQEAVMETGQDEGPCNIQCYSPGGPNKTWCVPTAYNAIGVYWTKVLSYPLNYSFWSATNNEVSLFFKAANQSVELKRTIVGACGANIEQYFCFGSNTTQCASLQGASTTTQQLKVYPNPTSVNNTISLELLSNDKLSKYDFENATIQLVDANDNIILQRQGNKIAKETLEIPALSNGTYYIRVINKNGMQTEQLIIRN